MKYIKIFLSIVLIGAACAVIFSPSIRGQLGLMSDEDRQHYTVNNGDIGYPVKAVLDISNIKGDSFNFNELTGKSYSIILASKGCPGCQLLLKDYSANRTSLSPPVYVLYFDNLTSKIIEDPKITYLLAQANRHFTYFNSPYTPTIYQINSQGVVVDKLIGYNDNNVKAIIR